MVQIPVERTINETYGFTFRNILSIFGIVWFPFLIAAAAMAAVGWWLWPDIVNLISSLPTAGDNAAGQAMLGFMAKAFTAIGPLFILFWVLQTMIIVGVQRKALGLIEGPVFIYFSLGGAVWRLMLAQFLAGLLLYVVMALAVAGVALVFGLGGYFKLPAIYGLVDAVAVIAAVCGCVYVFVRLVFFLPTAVVAEGGIGIGRAWQLGGGNFWRIVALVLVCVVVPMMGLGMISSVVTTPLMMNAMIPLQRAAEAHEALSAVQFWAQLWPVIKTLALFTIVYQLVTTPIILGLTNAVSARAYKNVTPPDAVALL
jgi:hypothetical protein